MGGEIEIVDKVGKKGTCFKFNTYLPICETDQRTSNARDQYEDIESNAGGYMSSGESYSTRNMHFSSPNTEGSQVVLFIKNEERCKVCMKFFERQGTKVLVAKHYEELSTILKRIRHRRVLSRNRSSKRSDALLQSISISRNSSTKSKEVPLSSLDGTDQEMPPTHRRSSARGSVVPNFILIVIDTDGGPFRELSRVVAEFRKNISTGCNSVVWLDKPGSSNIQLQGLNEDKLPPSDIIISKPFHGSRLYQVLKLLPEFGGEMTEATPPSINSDTLTIISATNNAADEASNSVSQPRPVASPIFAINLQPDQIVEIKEVDKPLSGKKVLLVEDEALLQRIATAFLSRLGAVTEICANGQEAVQTVCKALNDQRTSHVLPYDCILMDCEVII